MMFSEISVPFGVTLLIVPVIACPAESVASTWRPARPLAHDCRSVPLIWSHCEERMMPQEVERVADAAAELALFMAEDKGSDLVGAGAVGW